MAPVCPGIGTAAGPIGIVSRSVWPKNNNASFPRPAVLETTFVAVYGGIVVDDIAVKTA